MTARLTYMEISTGIFKDIEAITEFQKDQFMQEVLGEELSQKLIESKRAEYRAYRTQVTEWEINEYLQKF